MIRINLLQIKEELRRAAIRNQLIAGVLIWVVVLSIVFSWHGGLTSDIEDVQTRTQQLQVEIRKVRSIIGEVEKIKGQKADLEKKIHTIQLLDADRKLDVLVLNQLGEMSPSELWFSDINIDEGHIRLEGVSVDNQVIGGFLRKLDHSAFFKNLTYGPSKQRKSNGGMLVFEFTVDADITPPTPESFVTDEELEEARR